MPKKKKQELLNKAAQHLLLTAIHLKRSNIYIEDNFLSFREEKNIEQQSFRGIRYYRAELKEDSERGIFLCRYTYSAGMRLVNKELEESDEKFILTTIEADFDAYYSSNENIENECIQAFGELNVGYHVWPYWREYVQSTCCRMGIDLIPVPLDKNKIEVPSKSGS
jgi:hypothetical protein